MQSGEQVTFFMLTFIHKCLLTRFSNILQWNQDIIIKVLKNIFWNRAEKKLSSIGSWENNKKAAVEAELKKMEVCLKLIFS